MSVIDYTYKWEVSANEFHEPYTHETSGVQERDGAPFLVTTDRTGPRAVMLERALALNGLLHRARAVGPDGPESPEAAALDQLRLQNVTVTANGTNEAVENYYDDKRWPLQADAINVHVVWRDGESDEERGETLKSDLALAGARSPNRGAEEAHPIVSRDHRLTRELLETLIRTAQTPEGTLPWRGLRGGDTVGWRRARTRVNRDTGIQSTRRSDDAGTGGADSTRVSPQCRRNAGGRQLDADRIAGTRRWCRWRTT